LRLYWERALRTPLTQHKRRPGSCRGKGIIQAWSSGIALSGQGPRAPNMQAWSEAGSPAADPKVTSQQRGGGRRGRKQSALGQSSLISPTSQLYSSKTVHRQAHSAARMRGGPTSAWVGNNTARGSSNIKYGDCSACVWLVNRLQNYWRFRSHVILGPLGNGLRSMKRSRRAEMPPDCRMLEEAFPVQSYTASAIL
jgi:hypothetical protein